MRRDIYQAIADLTGRAIPILLTIGAMTPNAITGHFESSRQADTLLIGHKLAASDFCAPWENVADNQPENPWHPLAQLITDINKIAFNGSELLPPVTSK